MRFRGGRAGDFPHGHDARSPARRDRRAGGRPDGALRHPRRDGRLLAAPPRRGAARARRRPSRLPRPRRRVRDPAAVPVGEPARRLELRGLRAAASSSTATRRCCTATSTACRSTERSPPRPTGGSPTAAPHRSSQSSTSPPTPSCWPSSPSRMCSGWRSGSRPVRSWSTTTVTAGRDAAVPVSFGFHPYLAPPGAAREDWWVELPSRTALELDSLSLPTGAATELDAEAFALGARTFDDLFAVAPGSRFSVDRRRSPRDGRADVRLRLRAGVRTVRSARHLLRADDGAGQRAAKSRRAPHACRRAAPRARRFTLRVEDRPR